MKSLFKTGLLASFVVIAGCNQAVTHDDHDKAGTDYSLVTPKSMNDKELPIWLIPNMPESAEAYYGPDSYHVIAQTQDPKATPPSSPRAAGGALTWITTDDGKKNWPVNDHGQDACSFIMPDGKRVVYTSTRDRMDLPVGNWSDETDYPQGAELYIADLDGGNVKRLTNNDVYDAEVSVSPDGRKIVFTRRIDGKLVIWLMHSDGTGERQLTFTDDWQEGEAYFMPDSETVIFRAWKHSEKNRLEALDAKNGTKTQTPMNIFSLKILGPDRDVQPRTFTNDTNWAPFPAPDGRHFLVVRIIEGGNWELFLADMAGGEPVRLTYNKGWDGMGAFSPDGKKMVFTRSEPGSYAMYSYVMDVSSLNLGPENYQGVPARAEPPAGWEPDPDYSAWQ